MEGRQILIFDCGVVDRQAGRQIMTSDSEGLLIVEQSGPGGVAKEPTSRIFSSSSVTATFGISIQQSNKFLSIIRNQGK